jgi:hypothetical protein
MAQNHHMRLSAAVRNVIERLERRCLLAGDAFGYIAEAYPFENINIPIDSAGRLFIPPDLGKNTFNFYGRNYSGADQLFASFTGVIGFGERVARDSNSNLSGSPFTRMLAPLWAGWSTSGATTQQLISKLEDTTGDDVPDRAIVQWNVTDSQIPRESRKTAIFQAILQLNTGDTPGDIIFNYVTLDTGAGSAQSNGASATVGIKDWGYQSNRVLVSLDDANNPLVGSGKAIRIRATAPGAPRARAGDEVSQPEGQDAIQLALDGSASTDPDESSSSLTYAWDFDLDGVYGETAANSYGDERGAKPTFVKGGGAGRDGPAEYPIVLRVTDSSGLTNYDKTVVRVTNVAPAPPTVVSGPTTANAGDVVTFRVSTTDPGNDIQGIGAIWGDPQDNVNFLSGSPVDATFVYYLPGTYTIKFYAADAQGGDSAGSQTQWTITIGPRPDVLLNDVGVLVVTTAAGNDTIAIDQQSGQVRLNRNGSITTYAPAAVLGINILSGDGNDTITTGINVRTSIFGGEGADTITSTNTERDIIDAGNGNNTVSSGDGNDEIRSGSGNDVVDAGAGDDAVLAGDGDNDVRVAGGAVVVGAGNDTVTATALTGAFFLTLGDGDNIAILNNSRFNQITSGNGNDSIVGGSAGDQIQSGNGADTISTGAGDDRIVTGGDATSGIGALIDAGEGDDDINSTFATTITAGGGDDDITVDAANEITGGDGIDRITANIFAGLIDAGAGDDLVRANSSAARSAVVIGGDGNDNVFTGDGHDRIYGGAGRDTIHAGNGGDLLSGGGGNDRLFGQGGNDRLYGGNGVDRLEGQGGNDRFVGGAGADTLRGGSGTNTRGDNDPLDALFGIS